MAEIMPLGGGFASSDFDSGCSKEDDTSAGNPLTPFDGDSYSDKEVRLVVDDEVLVDRENKFIDLRSEATESIRSVSPVRKKPRLTLRKARSRIAPMEWESVKDTIMDLYLEKDYTLTTVMDIMSKPPYNFQATPKMYKNQFAEWGFAKNLTKNRVRKILNPVSIKNKIVSGFNAARIDRYLKRKKIPQDTTSEEPRKSRGDIFELSDSSVYELSDTFSHDLEECEFPGRSDRKYIIAVDSESSHVPQFVAESWGDQEYHGLEERRCSQYCNCRLQCGTSKPPIEHIHGRCGSAFHQHSHKFRVNCIAASVTIDIYDQRLLSNLCRAIPPLSDLFVKSPSGVMGARRICGPSLLSYYRDLKYLLANSHRIIALSQDDLLDLKLLVNGLLEDGDVWLRLGTDHLRRTYSIDAELLNTFLHQRLMQGVQSLDKLFTKTSKRIEPRNCVSRQLVNFLHELDTSHSSTTNDHSLQLGECSSSPISLSEGLIRALPGHFIIDNFHDDLVRDFPQLLPTISRGTAVPIIFSDELNNFNIRNTSARFDENTIANTQTEQNMMLIAACRSGSLSDVTFLLDKGASPNCLVVRLLVFRGANLEDKAIRQSEHETLRYTALWAATKTNQPTITRFLLEHGADLNGRSTVQSKAALRSFTCMSEAARLGLTEMFKLLLMWDTSFSEGLKETRLVRDSDPAADKVRQLFCEIKTGTLHSFTNALKNVGDPNILMPEGTPLSVAAECNQSHKVRILLDHGADVQLACLYLSRSGQEQNAKALAKTVYGSQNISMQFIKQYERLVQLSQSSQAKKLRSFRRHYFNFRQAWALGIEVMQDICRGKPPDGPDCLHRTLALLAVARAVAETTVGNTGDILLLDKFDTDLLRWQLLFKNNEDLSPYKFAVHELWKVNLDGSLFLDLDFEDTDTLGRFNSLISRLIGGAREPLGLDNSSGYGLNAAFSRWKERHPDTGEQTPPAATSLSVQSNYVSESSQENEQPKLPPERAAPTPCEKIMNREMILEQTSWLDQNSEAATRVFFFECTGVAEHLIRGVVFSIVFVFIHGLRSLAKLYMEKCFGLVERFTVMLRLLGFLEACERVSHSKVHDGTSKLLYEQDTVIEPGHLEDIWPATTPSNQWYSLISCSADIWI